MGAKDYYIVCVKPVPQGKNNGQKQICKNYRYFSCGNNGT